MHPHGSILLAYLRQQPCHGWTGGVEGVRQHLASCRLCCRRCEEYMDINLLLERWAYTRSCHPDALFVERLMQKARDDKIPLVGRLVRCIAPTSWRFVSLPVALALVFLYTVVIIVLARGLPGGNNRAHAPQIQQATVPAYTTGALTPQPTAVIKPTASPTSSGGRVSPVISVCTTSGDLVASRLRICGAHFTPGSLVVLIIVSAGRAPRTLPPVVADSQGMMQDVLIIHSCNSLPLAIMAQNMTSQSETSQLLKNITFSNCSQDE